MLTGWLLEGLIYALVLGFMMTVSQLIHARIWLSDYPKSIQDAVPPLSQREKMAKRLLGIPFMFVMVGYPIFSSFILRAAMGGAYNLWIGFAHMLVIFNTFNLFDLLVLDWLIFCFITPKYIVIDGTKGLAAYKDYGFHAKGALKGFGMSIVFAALVTGILSL